MPKILLTLAAAFMLVLAGMSLSFEAKAADTNKPRANLDRSATASPKRPCPDGYSCYPLYGAYGPYGGGAYWASYTYGGWGSGR